MFNPSYLLHKQIYPTTLPGGKQDYLDKVKKHFIIIHLLLLLFVSCILWSLLINVSVGCICMTWECPFNVVNKECL